MILGFSTQLNGKPTYFIEKIWKGLLNKNCNLLAYNRYRTEASLDNVIDQWDYSETVKPKLHTIREDPKDCWKVGNKIDFFVNVRKKDMFRFAPVLPVVSVQKIEILYSNSCCVRVLIDQSDIYAGQTDGEGIKKYYKTAMLELAQNDGFDSVEDFFAYFDKDFTGKLIHWTDLKY